MEGEAFLDECIALKEGMDNMKESCVNLVSDIYDIFMVAEMYHSALKKEEEESDRISHELEITTNSLESTKTSLQESKLQIYHLRKELKVSHLSRCMEGNVLGIVEEFLMEDGNEKSSYLQVLVKEDTIEYTNQTLVSL